MQNSHRTKAWLASLLLIAGGAIAQQPTPSVCKGHPLSIEEQLASAQASSKCDGMSPACERIPKDSDDLIFVGTVTKLTEAPGEMYIDDACTDTTVQTVTLLVKESFSGRLPQTVTVHAGYINGYWFQPKTTALVFAKKLSDGTIFVSGCQTSRVSVPLDWPTKEDLAYLRSRDKLPPTGSLLVNTWVVPNPAVNDKAVAVGFGSQALTINGPVSTRITTSTTGEFRLGDLPPGKYNLHLNSSLHVEPGLGQQTEILPKGCAAIRFYIESDTDYRRIVSSILKSPAKK
jgi:hypothetical protein